MVVIPADTPVTTPVTVLIAPTEVLLLLQLPPGMALDKVAVPPEHDTPVPVIAGIVVTCIVIELLAVSGKAQVALLLKRAVIISPFDAK